MSGRGRLALVRSPNDAVISAALWPDGADHLDVHRGVFDEAPSHEPSDLGPARQLSAGDVFVTWMKTRPELFHEMAADDLSESAALAHLTGLGWLYSIEHDDCLIPRRLVAKILTLTDDPMAAVSELCAARYWREEGKHFRVVHDAETVRQSLAAQWAKRDKDARGKAAAKAKRESEASASASMPASAAQPNNLTTEQPARTRATAERLAPDGRVLGYCGNCNHWDPLGDDALCDHCSRPGAVSRTVSEAEADLAPESDGGRVLTEDEEWEREWGAA